MEVLGGFTSSIVLSVIACFIAIESLTRFFDPQIIQFNQAIYVGIVGLVVNVVSAFLLQEDHRDHHHSHGHHDHNLRAAYLHVLADALTSVFAIVALMSGKFLGWTWLDPIMGLVGALVIIKWAYELAKETGVILLDGGIDRNLQLAIIDTIERDADNRITDLHVWRLSESHLAATIALVTHCPQKTEHYRSLLSNIPNLSHVIIEVNQCHGEPCLGMVAS